MADEKFQGKEKRRFPALVGLGLLFALVVIVVAFVADANMIGWPVLVLTFICLVAAIGFRLITGSARGGDGSDSDSESNFPKQEPRDETPLGDTPEVHDEISVHDIPIDAPERRGTERAARGREQTTPGPNP